MFKITKSLSIRIAALFLLGSITPLAYSNWVNLNSSENTLWSSIKENLSNIATLKQKSLEEHLGMIRKNAEGLSNLKVIQQLLTSSSTQQEETYKQAFDLLLKYQESHWGIFHHVFLCDTDGQVVLSPPHGNSESSHHGHDISSSPFFKQSLNESTITDFFGFEESTHYHQLFLHPVKSDQGQPLGVIVFEVVIDHVLQLLEQDFKLGETGKISLISLNGVVVVQDKEDKKDPISNTGFQKAISEQGTVNGIFRTLSGTSIFGVYQFNPTYPWVLAVEIDESEAMQTVSEQSKAMQSTFILCLTVLCIIGLVLGKSISKPLIKMSAIAKHWAQGKLNEEIHYHANNELGDLADNLNQAIQNTRGVIEVIEIEASKIAESSKLFSDLGENLSSNVASALDHINVLDTSIQQTANQANESSQVSNHAVTLTQQMNEAIYNLGQSGKEIGKTVDAISEVTDSTNLLALNASVEAARAGQAGAAFAVVASAVKELAEQTQGATEIVSVKIDTTQGAINTTIEQISEITKVIKGIDDLSKSIASEMNGRTSESSRITKKSVVLSSEAAQEAKVASSNLAQMADSLNNQVLRFKI